MDVKQFAELVEETWLAAMSDDGRIWAQADERLQAAVLAYPELYDAAVEYARGNR